MIYMGSFSEPYETNVKCRRIIHTGVKNRGFIIDTLSCSISNSYKFHILRFGEGWGKHVWNTLVWICVVWRKKMVPLTAHYMPVFTSWNGTLWFNMEFSVDQYLLFWEFIYPQRWNQVSLLNRRNVGVFLQNALHKGSISQNSGLLHDVS